MRFALKIDLLILAITVILFFTGCSNAEQSSAKDYGINNCSIVYCESGVVEYENHGNNTNEQTVYELASNGKTVAAYTALAMVDDGILSLDEKIAPYLDPELVTDDERLNDITLRQLLCHTAGFSPNYELGTDKKIYTDPGTAFCYSGVGYIYLQSVIENASGMTVDQAADKYVFGPLGMHNSTFESADTITPYMNLSSALLYALAMFVISFAVLFAAGGITGKLTGFRFYSLKTALIISFAAAGVINALFLLFFFISKVLLLFVACFVIMAASLCITRKTRLMYFSVPVLTCLILASGFVIPVSIPVTNDITAKDANCAYTFKSTSEDMSLFCCELMNRAKTQDDFYNVMFEPAVTINETNSWGLGIAIENTNGSATTYWHSGINPGFQSLYVLYPEQDRFVIILTNSDNGLDYAKEIAREHLGVDGVWDITRGSVPLANTI